MSADTYLGPEYYERKASWGERLKPLGKACHDCAVVCGFYRCFSDELAEQPEPTRTEASYRWSCHNHPDRACRGNLDNIAVLTTPTTNPERGNPP